jgi:hypothetical protein
MWVVSEIRRDLKISNLLLNHVKTSFLLWKLAITRAQSYQTSAHLLTLFLGHVRKCHLTLHLSPGAGDALTGHILWIYVSMYPCMKVMKVYVLQTCFFTFFVGCLGMPGHCSGDRSLNRWLKGWWREIHHFLNSEHWQLFWSDSHCCQPWQRVGLRRVATWVLSLAWFAIFSSGWTRSRVDAWLSIRSIGRYGVHQKCAQAGSNLSVDWCQRTSGIRDRGSLEKDTNNHNSWHNRFPINATTIPWNNGPSSIFNEDLHPSTVSSNWGGWW